MANEVPDVSAVLAPVKEGQRSTRDLQFRFGRTCDSRDNSHAFAARDKVCPVNAQMARPVSSHSQFLNRLVESKNLCASGRTTPSRSPPSTKLVSTNIGSA